MTSKTKIGAELVTVTPKMAYEWLDSMVLNRPVLESYVDELAAAMKAGEFRVNGQTIVFDESGKLLDGQHRLWAVIKSEKDVELLVVRNVHAKAFDTIDTGRKRTLAHVFAIERHKNASALSGAVGWLWKYQNDAMFQPARPRHAEARALLAKNAGLVDAVDEARRAAFVCSPSIAAFAHYVAKLIDEEAARIFLDGVIGGERLTKDSAIYRLRDMLIKNKADTRKVRPVVMAAWWVKAWNAYRAGKTITAGGLSFRNTEPFPTFSESQFGKVAAKKAKKSRG